ncbi:ABC transporter substrate-binding protein [Lacisediminihabitans changchengi]|uniref:Sugar ABC transporter substrate-binding protein n=1 Tax=Lacisediminihabitans changchengi TaxID=2787634 RepID=A0A934VWY0_9MICO|nr:sugar ABC transporter substrate-binding protein [Lacisediminihabitans changchengi]MBK4346292.1 sugar ABC transporter substrate-binding protein [Lacisediminihabitans changchengi]
MGIIAIAAGAALALSACAGGSAGSSSPQSIDGKITGAITFQTWNLKAGFKDYFEGLISSFEKKHPGTEIKWLDQPADNYAQKLQAQVTSNSLPDVVNTAPDLAYPLAQAGALLDLGKADPKAKSLYLADAWDSTKYADPAGSFAYPWYLNTGPTFFNKKLFTEAGLDAAAPPKSYDDMLKQAAQLGKAANGKFYMWGNVPTIIDLAENGVKVITADQTKFTFDSSRAEELLKEFKAAYDAKGILPAGLSASYTGVGDAFMSGQVAMNSGSAYDLKNFDKNAPELAQNLGIAPAFSSTGVYQMSVQDLSVSSKSKNTPTAVAFAKYVTNAENQMAFAKIVNIFPSSTGSLDDPFFSKTDGTQNTELRVAAAAQLKSAESFRPPVFTAAMETYVQQQFADAILGKTPIKDALANAVAKCNQLLG